MSELRKIYCKTLDDLPSMQIIKNELLEHDRIRIDYDINSNFKSSNKLKEYLSKIQENFNVEIQKGEFKELEFYNIYQLFSNSELSKILMQLKVAVIDYRLTSEKLIKKFEEKYNYNFIDSEKSIFSMTHDFNADQHKLSKYWKYRFHGGDVCFSNSKTGQIVDVNLKFGKYYGVLDLWFFQCFIQTTKEYTSLSANFKNNTPKLIQSLNHLKEKGFLSIVKNKYFESEKLIWNKEK